MLCEVTMLRFSKIQNHKVCAFFQELERVNHELEIEKNKLENFTKDVQEEYERMKR